VTKIEVNEKVNKKIKLKKKVLKKLFKKYEDRKSTKKALLLRSKYKWEDFNITKSGRVFIRCQSKLNSIEKIKQCRASASKDKLFCRVHGGRGKKDQKKFDELKSVYTGDKFKGLQSELKQIENISPEELQDTTSELKVAISLLRAYLKKTPDDSITKNPGQLMYIIGEIARLKKEHYEIKHAKNFSFTREQVLMMFIHFQTALVEVIKDTTLLGKVSDKIKEVGKYIEGEGFTQK